MNKVELIYITPNAAQKIENIACVCYNSEPTEDCKIFKGCMKSGHFSVAEHSDITFKVTCSRACSHQLVRHRTGKFTQRSQRYCKEDGFDYYIPQSIANDRQALEIYNEVIHNIQANYKWLLDMGVEAEDARYILPNACETTIFITMDFRNFFHFLNERLCTRAQKEIRDIAKEMAKLAVEACPIIKPYCVPKCESFSIAYCPEHKGCGRHKPLKEIVKEEYR
jgi:thymidylate synthase (FAD)